MIVVGLTGGIASGKSTVASFFEELGARRIDADRLAREALARGTPGWAQAVARFGRGILLPDGEIDRKGLAARVFADAAERRALEAIVHPAVRESVRRRLAEIGREEPSALVVLEVPLLFETGMDRGCDARVVVFVPEALQIERLMARDGIDREEALRRIRAQMPLSEKCARADWVIDNAGPLAATQAQVRDIYRRLAAAQVAPS